MPKPLTKLCFSHQFSAKILNQKCILKVTVVMNHASPKTCLYILHCFQVYDCELEKVEGFAEFNDFVQSFPLERGKAMEADEDMEIAGEFKGSFRIYPLPHDPNAELPPRQRPDIFLQKNCKN